MISRFSWLLVALSLVSCDIDSFDPRWRLDRLRILAIQADPPEVRWPGDSFSAEALAFSPRSEALSYRWSSCLLEMPFATAMGGGGGSGGSSAERIPTEAVDPPESCFDVTHARVPEVAEGARATFSVPFELSLLLNLEVPELPEGLELPSAFAGIEALDDVVNLAVLGGLFYTVSLEVSDGAEVVVSNKRVVFRPVRPPGAGQDKLDDSRDGSPGLEQVTYQRTEEHLTLAVTTGSAVSGVLRGELRSGARVSGDVGADGMTSLSLPLPSEAEPLAFRVFLEVDETVVDVAPDRTWRFVTPGTPNTNPAPPGVRGDSGALLETVVGAPGSDAVIRPGTADDDDREPWLFLSYRGEVQERKETLFFSWFVTDGELEGDRTKGQDDDLESRWTAPTAGMTEEGRLFVVVRDGRGGTAWSEARLRNSADLGQTD